MKISALMCVYNESKFVDYAIRSCIGFVDHLVIVEGAYQQTIDLGQSPRSTDGTIEICKKYVDNKKIFYIEANEQSDPQQRQIGLNKIKELNPDGWMLIIDGDEVYDENTLKMIKVASFNLDRSKNLAAYFKSLTFVNDFKHYTIQEFPRLFKITPGMEFVNDNFVKWTDLGVDWFSPFVIKMPYIKFHHYAFCKGQERFVTKKTWWENRFGKNNFNYSWFIDSDGKINDTDHKIVKYTGKHPEIMEEHPLWKLSFLS